RSRQESRQRSLNLKATDSGCPEEHFDGDTLSHERDDDEGGLSGAHIKSTQLTREDTDCFQGLCNIPEQGIG
ncbi:hypothetical protein GBAR_LOCUS6876, partial [Geodia barretti]